MDFTSPESGTIARASRWPLRLRQPAVQFPVRYVLFVLFSTLDILVTWEILIHSSIDIEVNELARFLILYGVDVNYDIEPSRAKLGLDVVVLKDAALVPLTIFKFCLVALVLVICEEVGRRRQNVGRTLATFAVAITAFPVFYGLGQIMIWMR